MASLIGKTLKGRYRVDDILGRGGMAEVYKVFDLQRGVPLAMKVLREDLAEDRVFLRRFQREAHNLSKLQHPNIVRFFGLEQEGRTAFILMDYIEGTTLRGLIFDTKGPLPHQQVLEIMQPICSALHYAHQQGIVHCDLKSANIMLDKNGKVYLTDFGIARMTDMATSTMVGIGTPAYMAPELIKGLNPTPQTDIYALGVMLYEMYTGGERPFTGERAAITGTTAERIRWEHLKLNPLPMKLFNHTVSPEIEKIILYCLAKIPSKRYESINKLQQALIKTKNESTNSQANSRDLYGADLKTIEDEVEVKNKFPPNVKNSGYREGSNSDFKLFGGKRKVFLIFLFTIFVGLILVLCKIEAKIFQGSISPRSYETGIGSRETSDHLDEKTTAYQITATENYQATDSASLQITATAEYHLEKILNDCLVVCSSEGELFLQDIKGEYFHDLLVFGDNPSWSPDGKIIVFDNDGYIYSMASDGSNITQLAEGEYPIWSPDGKSIVFTNNDYIYSMDVTGSNNKQLVEGKNPLWSPDGDSIVFVQNWDDIYLIDSQGSNIRKIAEGTNPSWSPNGNQIIFEHYDEIYTIDPNGKNYLKITWLNDSWSLGSLSMSPNGHDITFTSSVFDITNVFIVGKGGSNPRRLTREFVETYSPSWSPEGENILFSDGDSLYISNKFGGDLVKLSANASSIDWSPGCRNGDLSSE